MVDHKLSKLPARPPTPPRSSFSVPKDDTRQSSAGQSLFHSSPALPSPSEPPQHPLSDSRSKRVNFSPMTRYIKPVDFNTSNIKSKSPLRRLRPSNQCQPAKSILKSKSFSNEEVHDDELRSSPSEDLSSMLQSAISQLSGESQLCRRDAYTQLLRSLIAYADQPRSRELIDNMHLFVKFIRRDMVLVCSSSNTSDSSLTHQALSLLSMFIYQSNLCSHLPNDFKAFVLDHAITSLQTSTTPKTIVIDYMRILAVQNFPPKVLTGGRVIRLLEALQETDGVKGKSVAASRIAIYERLLLLAPSVFTNHSNLWMDQIISAFLNKVKEIRIKAIQLGFRITESLGQCTAISKAIQETLDLPLENDGKFVDDLSDRLLAMISSRESGSHVPQIWSIIILFLRKPRWSIERWVYFKRWMLIIQKCFNCSDPATNSQALLAWNRLVYASQLNGETGKEMTKFLFRPILSQLERKRDSKRAARIDEVFFSYYNLLYYSFKPGVASQRLDFLWKEYVTTPTSTVMNSNPSNAQKMFRVLAFLFWNPQVKVWDEKKVESNRLEADDLPRLDCKWVRSNVTTILPVFETLLRASELPTAGVRESPIGVAWAYLSRSLGEASSKEIQPSFETMEAIASILETLQRIWKNGPAMFQQAENCYSDFYNFFAFLLKTIVSEVGPLPFTDKALLKTSLETFRVAQTPTHRRAPSNGVVRLPILHILHFMSFPPAENPSSAYKSLISNAVGATLNDSAPRARRLELLRQFAESLLNPPEEESSDTITPSISEIWSAISAKTVEAMQLPQPENGKEKDDSTLRDFDKVGKILMTAVKFQGLSVGWSQLFEYVLAIAQAEKFEIAISTMVEAIADRVLCHNLPTSISLVITLMKAVTLPSKQNLDPPPSSNIFGPKRRLSEQVSWEHIFSLAAKSLRDSYDTLLTNNNNNNIPKLLNTVVQWVDACPPGYKTHLLGCLQSGVAPWVVDSKHRLVVASSIDKGVITSYRSLVSTIVHSLQGLSPTDSALLSRLDVLFSAGFGSHHKSTVNQFILMWNKSFGLQEELAYPMAVEPILRKLQSFVDLRLPCFPQRNSKSISPPPDYIGSQEDIDTFPSSNTPLQAKLRKGGPATPKPSPRVASGRVHKKKKNNGTSTPKLRPRHDDSQMQFVPVESSPGLDGEAESQLLTENQKDVRERQQAEIAHIFSELQAPSSSRNPTSSAGHVEHSTPTPRFRAIRGKVENASALPSPTPGFRDRTSQMMDLDTPSFPSTLEWISSSEADLPSSPVPQTRPMQKGRGGFPVDSQDDNETPTRPHSSHDMAQNPPDHKPIDFSSYNMTIAEDGENTPNIKAEDVQLYVEATTYPTTQQAATNNVEATKGESTDRVEIVPDSFGNELEQQIASQLEQDLELCLDLKVSESQESSKPESSRRGRKRKRGSSQVSRNVRGKRQASTPSVVIPLNKNTADVDHYEENADTSNALASSSQQQQQRPASRRRKKSPKKSTSVERNGGSQTSNSESPQTLEKRRSLRLRGQPASSQSQGSQDASPVREESKPLPEDKAEVDADTDMVLDTDDISSKSAAGVVDNAPNNQDTTTLQEGPAIPDSGPEPRRELQTSSQEGPATSILKSLKSILGSLRHVSFGKSVLREMDDVMFDLKLEAHHAVQRHGNEE